MVQAGWYLGFLGALIILAPLYIYYVRPPLALVILTTVFYHIPNVLDTALYHSLKLFVELNRKYLATLLIYTKAFIALFHKQSIKWIITKRRTLN